MSYESIFKRLWTDYTERNPNALRIYDLLVDAGEHIVNDHIALRTFNDPRVNINVIAQPFLQNGYVEAGQYHFPVKQLMARHFAHPGDPQAPKVFISELKTEVFSKSLQTQVAKVIESIPQAILDAPEDLLFSKRPWAPVSFEAYESILQESDFAAWLLAYGYGANHFTISVNHLHRFNTLEKLNAFITSHGYTLNTAGGVIKGSAHVYFEQSSTMAEVRPMAFAGEVREVSSCYYEFARRYIQPDGSLFQGFITSSADKLFESTKGV